MQNKLKTVIVYPVNFMLKDILRTDEENSVGDLLLNEERGKSVASVAANWAEIYAARRLDRANQASTEQKSS